MEYILFLGGALGFLLSLFLFNKKENIVANRMLAITLFVYSLDIFYALYLVTKFYNSFPQFIGLNGPLPFIYCPSLFLYAHLVSENKKSFKLKYLFHFLPVTIMLLAGIVGIFIYTNEDRLALMNPVTQKSIFIIIMRTIIPLYGMFYIYLSLSAVRKYHRRLKENFSDIEKLKLNWLIYLLIGISLVWLLELVQIILIDIIGKPEDIAYKYIYAAVSVLIYLITYKSLMQPEVFSDIELNEKESGTDKVSATYIKSGLTEEYAQKVLNRLLEIMERDKPYLKNNLSLTDLSVMLDTTSHNLSEIINTKLNKSFYDFINGYRVEEVKRILNDEKYNLSSLLNIAFNAGFNSKSTFNYVFKKITGITPTEYRRNFKESNPGSITD